MLVGARKKDGKRREMIDVMHYQLMNAGLKIRMVKLLNWNCMHGLDGKCYNE